MAVAAQSPKGEAEYTSVKVTAIKPEKALVKYDLSETCLLLSSQ